MFFFQLPLLPERWLKKNDGENLARMFRAGSPGEHAAPSELIDAEKRALLSPGRLGPALAYYRTAFRVSLPELLRGPAATPLRPIELPVTLIWGEADSCLGLELIDGSERYAPLLNVHRVANAGHFVHQERPEVVNRAADRRAEFLELESRVTVSISVMKFDESHELYQQTCLRFAREKIEPYVVEWEEAGTFPRELYREAAQAGILGVSFPEAYGGGGGDLLALDDHDRGAAHRRLQRARGQPRIARHRSAPGPVSRQRRATTALRSAGAGGRKDRRARDHRAGNWQRRRRHHHARRTRRRQLRAERFQAVHHQRHSRRLRHGPGAHGRRTSTAE